LVKLIIMDSTVQIRVERFKFNKLHLLLLTAVIATIFVLINYLTVKHAAKNLPEFKYNDITGIAEEIYTSGTIEALASLPLEAALKKKLSEELLRILAKTTDCQGCEVYYLEARLSNNFPVLGYGDEIIGVTFLKIGEVWKVGMTGCGVEQRYPNDNFYRSSKNNLHLSGNELRYKPVFAGSYKHALILERILIYSYPLWSGHPTLIKPPGCKIFR